MGNASLWKALEVRDALYAKPHDELTDADGMRLGELEGIVGEEGGYTAEADAAGVFGGLGVGGVVRERKVGGQGRGPEIRGVIASAAFRHPAAVALREPAKQLEP